MTKFLGISVDDTLGGNSPSDAVVSSQKAVKKYIDDHGGGGSVDIDGKSITTNSSDELQTVGVIDQRNTANAIKTWTGTKAQYDAISTKDANTIYNITDDTNPTQALLEAIYPVGSIYIGTMNVCPLSALFGTWQLVGTKVLVDIPAQLAAKGNGYTLGLTNGTTNSGLTEYTFNGTDHLGASPEAYNKQVSTSTTISSAVKGFTGITTDSTKSGIVADTNATALTVNIWERTA